MSTPTRVYRLTVKWPTPDGKPFKDQSWMVWDMAILHAAGGNPGSEWPAWLPEDVDILRHVPDDETGDCDRSHCTLVRVSEPHWRLILWVPDVRKRHYFSHSAADEMAKLLTEWGCTVTVDESQPLVWPAVRASD
jgi:hypothetical protein